MPDPELAGRGAVEPRKWPSLSAGACGRNQHVSEVTGPPVSCTSPVPCPGETRLAMAAGEGSQTPGWRQRCPSDKWQQ